VVHPLAVDTDAALPRLVGARRVQLGGRRLGLGIGRAAVRRTEDVRHQRVLEIVLPKLQREEVAVGLTLRHACVGGERLEDLPVGQRRVRVRACLGVYGGEMARVYRRILFAVEQVVCLLPSWPSRPPTKTPAATNEDTHTHQHNRHSVHSGSGHGGWTRRTFWRLYVESSGVPQAKRTDALYSLSWASSLSE